MTVFTFLAVLYYFSVVLGFFESWIFFIALGCLVVLSGVFISKLAVDPLEAYVKKLQDLSKETLHELNLPVATISTNTQMLKKTLDDVKTQKRLERIEKAAQMLQESYNELDYLIKMQTTREIEEVFFLDVLVRERVAFLDKLYPHKNFILNLEPYEVKVDKIGLAKVIDNLIDNGVKYSPQSDTIHIFIKENALFIQDYGIGIDELELVHIFDKYYQSNTDTQGFGIGLSMVKRYCDDNALKLFFHTKKGEGTTVEIQFNTRK